MCGIYNSISKRTNKPLSMQFVDLLNTLNVKTIYDRKYLLNSKVTIEKFTEEPYLRMQGVTHIVIQRHIATD